MAGEFRKQFDDALKEAELDDLKKLADDARRLNPAADIKKAFNPLETAGKDVRAGLAAAFNPPKAEPPKPKAPEPAAVAPAAPAATPAAPAPAAAAAMPAAVKPKAPAKAKAPSKPAPAKPAPAKPVAKKAAAPKKKTGGAAS
jgi:sec-independent protein translocase protein TatB